MSFGLSKQEPKFASAIRYAHDNSVLVVAAAGNHGSLESVAYPARDALVLCVHAATGFGNMYNGNPTKKSNGYNVALLGVGVNGFATASHKDRRVRRSGTSQACAMAVGVAALIMQIMQDFAETARGLLDDQDDYEVALTELRKADGMGKVFEATSQSKRTGYDIVQPWSLVELATRPGEKRLEAFLSKVIGQLRTT
jgi:subtilisin family serine protease